MSSPEPTHPTIASPKYSNRAEAQEYHFKINFMMMIEILKKEIDESIKKSRKRQSKI